MLMKPSDIQRFAPYTVLARYGHKQEQNNGYENGQARLRN